ncbi:sulfotransferase family 2 domain-containing protein [Cyanobacterium aponinum UTEX 3222]|uniref:sulfotransferase family 2 domain-containing protein n=1 Tax=Cyanobacterium aponinum TaxID=379064 RepID=UPI00308FB580|nr:sulfotransferase family 2 domain-containing protein [Cyanobacterium aponinum UTEX 3222]
MIISHEYKFIMFCNPKTGTTSLEKALQNYNEYNILNNGYYGLWANKHMPPAIAKGFLPLNVYQDYFKFVFVRHPFDWVISQYKYQAKLEVVSVTTLVKKTVSRST